MLFEDRSRAESFGAVADLYDRVRPSYPPALIDALLAQAPGGRPVDVLDVGCGTGIAGALLAARGANVLGVEIDPRMAALARAKGLTVEEAPFERWDDAGRRFDLLICGQAWHWIDPATGTEKAARVLRPRRPDRPVLEPRRPVAGGARAPGADLFRARARAGELLDGAGTAVGARPRFARRPRPSRAASSTSQVRRVSVAPDLHQRRVAGLPAHAQRPRVLPATAARAAARARSGEAIDELGGSFEVEYEATLVSVCAAERARSLIGRRGASCRGSGRAAAQRAGAQARAPGEADQRQPGGERDPGADVDRAAAGAGAEPGAEGRASWWPAAAARRCTAPAAAVPSAGPEPGAGRPLGAARRRLPGGRRRGRPRSRWASRPAACP